jgi:GNAT superfamily N-acetyltransferase
MNIEEIQIRNFKAEYAPKLSEIIISNLIEINSKDYSEEKIQELIAEFSPDLILKYAIEREIYVAIHNTIPVGTLSVQESWSKIPGEYVFLTIFVDKDFHRCGIGRMLLQKGEEYVNAKNGKNIYIPSSVSSHKFYFKYGYKYKNEDLGPDKFGCIPMQKVLN